MSGFGDFMIEETVKKDQQIRELEEKVRRLQSDLAAARADAERYRWLRAESCVPWNKGRAAITFNIGHDWISYGDAEKFDEAIDAALSPTVSAGAGEGGE